MTTTTETKPAGAREISDDVAFDACLKRARRAERERDAANRARYNASRFGDICVRRLGENRGKSAKAKAARLGILAELADAERSEASEACRARRNAFVVTARNALLDAWCARRRVLWDAWKAAGYTW